MSILIAFGIIVCCMNFFEEPYFSKIVNTSVVFDKKMKEIQIQIERLKNDMSVGIVIKDSQFISTYTTNVDFALEAELPCLTIFNITYKNHIKRGKQNNSFCQYRAA